MTKLEEFWCKGYSFRAIFGQDTCTKWKTLGKNTEKHSTSKKGESLKLINLLITIFEKENLVLEGHKVFPPTPCVLPQSDQILKYWNTAPARKQNSI